MTILLNDIKCTINELLDLRNKEKCAEHASVIFKFKQLMEAKFDSLKSPTKYVKLGKDKSGRDVHRRGLCQGQLAFFTRDFIHIFFFKNVKRKTVFFFH